MRLIGSLPTESDAHRIGDHLLSIGMRNHVEPAANGDWLLWIEHDDHLEQAQLQLRQYQANPNDPRYANAHAVARAARAQAEAAAKRRQRNFTDVRTSWAGLPTSGRPVTIAVCLLCVIIFVLQSTDLGPTLSRWFLFYTPMGMRPMTVTDFINRMMGRPSGMNAQFTLRDAFALVGSGQLWRLVTPALMHANFGHILFNVWAFLQVGTLIESRKGPLAMLMVVFFGAVISCSGQAAWDGLMHTGNGFVGLSGVVYATFGYAWIRGRIAPHERVGLNQQTTGMMFTWLVLCMTGLLGPIANAAHVVGLLVGISIGYAPLLKRKIGWR